MTIDDNKRLSVLIINNRFKKKDIFIRSYVRFIRSYVQQTNKKINKSIKNYL